MESIGKAMMILGVLIAITGGLIWLCSNLHGFSRLPGDILIRKGNLTVYIPVATSIVISLVLSLVLWLFSRR
jgi:hypothetical protein